MGNAAMRSTWTTISSSLCRGEGDGSWNNQQQTLFWLLAPVGRHFMPRQVECCPTSSLEGAADLLMFLSHAFEPSQLTNCRLKRMFGAWSTPQIWLPQDGDCGPVCFAHLENEYRGQWYKLLLMSREHVHFRHCTDFDNLLSKSKAIKCSECKQ